MRTFHTVYRYRYDENTGAWQKIELKNVLVSGTLNSYALSDTQNRDANLTLRVVSGDVIDVLPEDVIAFIGKPGDTPPQGSAVVVSVTDNRRGGKYVRHTKILCK